MKTIVEFLTEARKPKISKTKIDDEFYHGTSIAADDDLFEPSIGYSDYDALWVTDELEIAHEFAENSNWGDESIIYATFKTEIRSTKIANLEFDLVKNLMDYYGYEDPRELIPILDQSGFDGWLTSGSVGRHVYNDIAIFNSSLLNFNEVQLLVDGDWTDWMSFGEAQDMIDKIRGSKED